MAFELTQIDDTRWRIEQQGAMRTSGIIYAGRTMLDTIRADQSLAQVARQWERKKGDDPFTF